MHGPIAYKGCVSKLRTMRVEGYDISRRLVIDVVIVRRVCYVVAIVTALF